MPNAAPIRAMPRARPSWDVQSAMTAWAVLIVALVGLEAYGFFAGSSTEGHPTISNIVNHGLRWNETRALAFFGWLAFGKWLLSR